MNLGMRVAYGNAFMFMGLGTTYPVEHLARASAALSDSGCSIILAAQRLVDTATGYALEQTATGPPTDPLALLISPCHTLDSVVLRREANDSYGDFVLNFPHFSHWH